MYDVRKFLQDNRIHFKTSGTNTTSGWVEIHCPFPLCNDPSEHMGINMSSSMYSCWKCGEHGSFTKLVKVILKCSWQMAEQISSEYFKPSLLTGGVREVKSRNTTFHFPKEATDKLPILHKEYLRDRGFSPKVIQEKYGVLACYQTGRYAYRLIIPIIMFGRPVSFLARDVTNEQEPRYKNMSNEESIIPAKHCIYGIDEISKGDNMLVVEGVFVKWRIGDKCVATLGTKYTGAQLKLIIDKNPKNTFIMYDKGAEKEADKLASALSPHIKRVETISIDSYEDYDDMTEKDVKQLRKDINL